MSSSVPSTKNASAMEIEDLKLQMKTTQESRCFRCEKICPSRKKVLGFDPKPSPKEEDIIKEARRCIYCYQGPCSQCCPIQLNVKEFVHAAAAENWYYASKVILSGNPMPLSTGNLCCVKNLCQGGCNLKDSYNGPIKTNDIQLFSVRKFREYNIKPLVPQSIGKKVAIVGSGPCGLSCAHFLRRFGIDVTIYEKENYAGGLLMSELIPNRLPLEDIQFEIQMVKDMNVEFKFNQKLGKDFTIDDLLNKEKFDAVFLAFGRPDDIKLPFEIVEKKTNSEDKKVENVLSSHEFLRQICGVLKLKNGQNLPDYTGKKVLILGAGETAIDCASAASKLGGDVTMAFRKDFQGMRAYPKDVEELLSEKVEFMPLMEPVEIIKNISDASSNVEVKFQLQERTIDGKYEALNEFVTKKYDIVITAFGATLNESKSLIPGKTKEIQKVEGHENVFLGGDLANSYSVAEAVNDAKIAAKMIAECCGVKDEIPLFKTEVDDVSLEVELDGNKFKNPFGIASSPTSGTYECIRNALKAGFGWVVTKTINLNKDLQKENDVRICRCDDNPGLTNTFFNLCLHTELSMEYWLDTIKKIKQEFPDRVIIANICCEDNKEDWEFLTKKCLEVGADGFEVGLSCPNGAHTTQEGFHDPNSGLQIGKIPEALQRVAGYVVEAANGKPVYPKISPNINDIIPLAKAAMAAKCNGISGMNTLLGLPKFYPDGTPFPQVGKKKYVLPGGLSGDILRPISLKNLSLVYNNVPNCHILGIGGIWNSYAALQHLYAGANVFEVCSGAQRYSYEIVHEMISGLQFYLYSWSRPDLRKMLSKRGEFECLPHRNDEIEVPKFKGNIPTLDELRGLGAKKVVEREQMDSKWAVVAKINKDKCLECGKCALSCRDNSVHAIAKDVDGKWKVDDKICYGCALCMSVCPVNAIELVQVPDKEWHH